MEVSSTTSTTANTPGSDRVPIRTLGQQDFLKLLVAQMTSQDPLNPQSDTEFIAQMAQFSSLEQSKAMQIDMSKLQASNMLGKNVELQGDDEVITQGAVTAVQIEAGTPMLVVNGQLYDLSQVLTISPGLDSSSTP